MFSKYDDQRKERKRERIRADAKRKVEIAEKREQYRQKIEALQALGDSLDVHGVLSEFKKTYFGRWIQYFFSIEQRARQFFESGTPDDYSIFWEVKNLLGQTLVTVKLSDDQFGKRFLVTRHYEHGSGSFTYGGQPATKEDLIKLLGGVIDDSN